MEHICLCEAFTLWYVDVDGPPILICTCGHPLGEHEELGQHCLGVVVVLGAEA